MQLPCHTRSNHIRYPNPQTFTSFQGLDRVLVRALPLQLHARHAQGYRSMPDF